MTRTIRTAVCTSIGIAMLVVATPATPRFSIVDLGMLPGDSSSVARDINNRGQIVGEFSGLRNSVQELDSDIRVGRHAERIV
jgi:hypothetical protein